MKYITTKLKRYNYITILLNLLIFPIRLPFYIIYVCGVMAEQSIEIIDSFMNNVRCKIVEVFQFDKIATEKYNTNEQFKNKCHLD